ncbi:MAG: hypothetical protein ACHQ4G_04900 [Opitutales bacterium]
MPGLAVLLTAELVAGVAQARVSAEWQSMLRDIQESHNLKKTGAATIGQIMTPDQAKTLAAQLPAQIAKLEAERAALEAQLKAAPEYLAAVSQQRSRGSLLGSTTAALIPLNYTGTDGKQRNYSDDQSTLLKLSADTLAKRKRCAPASRMHSSRAT